MKSLLALFFLCSSTLVADEVILTSGGTVDGAIQETPEGYRIDAGYGVFTIPKSRVKSVRFERGPVHEFNDRLEKLKDSKDAEALFDAAVAAQSNKMTRHLRPLLQRVLAINPRHEGARAMVTKLDTPPPRPPRQDIYAQEEARRREEARRQYAKDVREFYEYVFYRATGLFGGELTWPYDRQPWGYGFVPWYESHRLGVSPRYR
jgi:hypothetical protein